MCSLARKKYNFSINKGIGNFMQHSQFFIYMTHRFKPRMFFTDYKLEYYCL